MAKQPSKLRRQSKTTNRLALVPRDTLEHPLAVIRQDRCNLDYALSLELRYTAQVGATMKPEVLPSGALPLPRTRVLRR
jgi:hypothetical protein